MWHTALLLVWILVFLMGGAFGQDIAIGMSLPLKGPSQQIGIELYRGAAAYFAEINKQGGVGGRRLNLIAYNDDAMPQSTIKNTVSLVEFDEVKYLLGYYSSNSVTPILPLLKKYSRSSYGPVYLLFPIDGSEPSRRATYKNWTVHLGPSYREQGAVLVGQLIAAGVTRIGIAYQADADGRSRWDSLRRALASRSLSFSKEVILGGEKDTPEQRQQQLAMLQSAPLQLLVLIGPYSANLPLLKSLYNMGWQVPILCFGSIGREALIERLSAMDVSGAWVRETLIFGDSIPNSSDSRDPLVAEYQRVMVRHPHVMPQEEEIESGARGLPYSNLGLLGFLKARTLVRLLAQRGSLKPNDDDPAEARSSLLLLTRFDGTSFVTFSGWGSR